MSYYQDQWKDKYCSRSHDGWIMVEKIWPKPVQLMPGTASGKIVQTWNFTKTA